MACAEGSPDERSDPGPVPQALAGLRVVECGEMVAAAYAAKLMADLGAQVVKVEPPQGDPARQRGPFPGGTPDPEKSGLFLYLNLNKLGITLDLRRKQGQELLGRLAAWADLLVHNYPPPLMAELGLDYQPLSAINPRLVMTSITRFGLTGPHRDYKGYEITSAHSGGWASLSPGALEDPELPPLKAFGQQADFQAGVNAAIASLGALYARLVSGQGQHIDVSIQECIAANLEASFVHWTYGGRVASRLGQRMLGPWGMLQCRDGLLFVVCVEEDQWQRFLEVLGNPEWGSWEVFGDRLQRAEKLDVLTPLMEEITRGWTVDALYQACQARRVPAAPVATIADLLASDHLQARGFFVQAHHPAAGTLTYPGAPYKFGETPWQLRRPAPFLGQDNEEVYCGWLGLSTAELAALRRQGLV
ncbi:MAG: CaiB/BaiF CoA transferase family protein [Dehalococcoidia bacterium]